MWIWIGDDSPNIFVMNLDNQLSEITVSYHPHRPVSDRYIIRDSRSAYEYIIKTWNPDTLFLFEEFKTLFLDRKNGVIGYRNLGVGNSAGVIVDIRQMFAIALKVGACGIILAHNHPSGQMRPSQADLRLTQKIDQGAKTLDIKLLDHLIIGDDTYYSFQDEGNSEISP